MRQYAAVALRVPMGPVETLSSASTERPTVSAKGKNSNVVEFCSHLDQSPEARQLTYYNSGIGAYVERKLSRLYPFAKQWLDNHIDLAIAWNFKKIVLDAYRWLSDHYEEGDRIYLFGFSRGAYQVRALAGMIETVGILFAGNQAQIPFAYELYEDQEPLRAMRAAEQSQTNVSKMKKKSLRSSNLAEVFKRTFSRTVKVHFVGAWDTVSSVGLFKGNLLPLTDTCDHVCYFRHALALDERRVKFIPEYVRCSACSGPQLAANSKANLNGDKDVKSPVNHKSSKHRYDPVFPHLKEVWFPGSHSDIGGGNLVNADLTRRHPSLLWIRHEAMLAGLRLRQLSLDPGYWQEVERKPIKITNSLTATWWPCEFLPLRWQCHQGATSYSWAPHLGKGRTIMPGQLIHISTHNTGPDYDPKAKFQGSDAKDQKMKDLLDAKGSTISGWQSRLNDTLRAHLETALYDRTMLASLVSQLKDREARSGLLEYLMHVIATQGPRQLLETADVIPILCRLPPTKHRNNLLINLAQMDRLYEQALASSDLDVHTQQQILDVHIHILKHEDLICGAKGLSVLIHFDDIRPMIVEANAVSLLAAGLESHQVREVEVCAVTLSILARFEDRCRVLMDTRIIPSAVSMLADEDPENIMKGARALRALLGRKIFRPAIFKSNILPGLVVALGCEVDRIRYTCGRTLAALAEHDVVRKAISNSGIILQLVEMLRSRHVHKIVGGAYGLHVLAVREDCRPQIIRANPIPCLLIGLSCESNQARFECGRVLVDLAGYGDTRLTVQLAGVISKLVTMLDSTDVSTRTGAASGLYFLAWHDGFAAIIRRTSAVRHLGILARSDKRDLALWASMASRRLTEQRD